MEWTPHATSDVAIAPIKEYCINRHYKCKGCRYSIKFIAPQYNGTTECVFANCPCDWEVPKPKQTEQIEINPNRKWVMSV